jgi:hypothetical protein
MDDVDLWNWTTVGVLAAAVAIVAWLGSVLHWCRAWWQRHHTLRRLLADLEAQNTTLVAAATDLSRAMIAGVGWSGRRIAPPELAADLDRLDEIDRALERLHARVRGLRAEAGAETMRADLEQAVAMLRRGVDLYRQGTWATYRASRDDGVPRRFGPPDAEGRRPYLVDAAGDEPVPALHGDGAAVDEARRLARDLELMVRSACYRLGDPERAESFTAGWPTRSYELA